MEKILTHISANDQVIPGKLSVADVAILNLYQMMVDAKINLEEELKTASPTAIKIVEKLQKCDKFAAMVKEARQVPFLPF